MAVVTPALIDDGVITALELADGAVTEIKIADDVNVSKFINDVGYLTTGGLGSVNTDAIAEGSINLYYTDDRVVNVVNTGDFSPTGTFNFTKIVVNPNEYPLPEFAQYSGYTGDNSPYFQYTSGLSQFIMRRQTSNIGVTFNEVIGTYYDGDITGATELGGPGIFYTVGDQTNGHRFLNSVFNKVNGITTDGNALDSYHGNFTLVTYEKESGANELGRNILTFDKNGAQFHNKLKVVSMPINDGTEFLSHVSLTYTGTQDTDPSASIQLYNATTDTSTTNMSFNDWSTTVNTFLSLDWLVKLAEIDTATLTGLGTQGVGSTAYCTDGDAGAPCLAVYDGTDWRRISFGAPISTT